MFGYKRLVDFFEQEREHARARGEIVSQNRTEDPEVWIDRSASYARAYQEEREERKQEFWENFKVLFKMVFIASRVVAVIVGLCILFPPQKNSHPDTVVPVSSQRRGEASAQIVYHYNMSREDWQDYQYQQSLKDIDAGVRELRMHNATLAAQRQAVVECRGDVEWLALAVPGAKFESTGVPCTKTNK